MGFLSWLNDIDRQRLIRGWAAEEQRGLDRRMVKAAETIAANTRRIEDVENVRS